MKNQKKKKKKKESTDSDKQETKEEKEEKEEKLEGGVDELATECEVCGKKGFCRMAITDIPFFKQVVIIAFNCEYCGNKTNEVKASGPISEKAVKLILKLESPDDLDRSILKSETASFKVPEIKLELAPGTLGGKFTTVEGLLTDVKNQFKNNPFFVGDSAKADLKSKIETFIDKLDSLLERDENKFTPFTCILDDPVGNSHIQNVCAPDPDPQLEKIEYERTHDQSEELGLLDIKTENYD